MEDCPGLGITGKDRIGRHKTRKDRTGSDKTSADKTSQVRTEHTCLDQSRSFSSTYIPTT